MYQPYILIGILIIAIILFIWDYWRYDVVAMMALITSVIFGLVPLDHAFLGFSNTAVIAVGSIMVLTKAVSQSGVLNYFIKRIEFLFKSTLVHIATLTTMTATLSTFMNYSGSLPLMMPIAIQTFINNQKSPSIILMPLAFASVLGGIITLIGTPPNILLSYYRQKVLGYPYQMFDYAPVGILVAGVGLLFIIFIGWRLIPARASYSKQEELFHISDYVTELKIPSKSPFYKKTIGEMLSGMDAEFELIAVVRKGAKIFSFSKDEILHARDKLIIQTSHENLEKVLKEGKFQLAGEKPLPTEALTSTDIMLMECAVPPYSEVTNRSAKIMQLRTHYGINMLAISRRGMSFRKNLNDVRLAAGDVVLLQGNAATLQETAVGLGFLPLVSREINVDISRKKIIPIIVFFAAILLTSLRILPIDVALVLGVLVLTILNITPPRVVYHSIDWPVLFLLAGMIPLGEAMQTTGAAGLITDSLMHAAGGDSPVMALIIIFLLTMWISDVMNNTATVVMMAPIAVHVSQITHTNVDTFFMAVAVATSCSFLTPIASHNYTMVMGPGQYKFFDYIRLGLPLEIIAVVVGIPAILWIWPL